MNVFPFITYGSACKEEQLTGAVSAIKLSDAFLMTGKNDPETYEIELEIYAKIIFDVHKLRKNNILRCKQTTENCFHILNNFRL